MSASSLRSSALDRAIACHLALALVLAGALAGRAASAQSGNAASGIQVERQWGPLRSGDGAVFLEAVPRADGSALVATGNSVFRIEPEGTVAPLGSGDQALLNPDGETFALVRAGDLTLYEASVAGVSARPAELGKLPHLDPFQIVKLIPGGKLLYAPRVRVREETPWVESARILRPDLTPVADFPAQNLEISRFAAGSGSIVYTQPHALTARRLDGGALWRAEVDVFDLETAAERTILVPRYVKGIVAHYLRGERIGSQAVEGVVWNLAISPSGRASAATTRDVLYLFRDGRLTGQVSLRVAYANSLAVSDRGEALVGGQSDQGVARLLLFDSLGKPLWSEEGGVDRNGYRPAVRFAPDGERFVVIEKRGLSAYRIERGQP